MRFVLAAFFVSAIGMPAASALPTTSQNSLSISKADPIVQVAKRKQASNRGSRKSASSGSAGGIRPLVGSGDY
jgi:hypothetical protein